MKNKVYLINIRGTNGSGKSTLLNSILHLTDNVSVKSFKKEISYFRKNGDFIESKEVKLSYVISDDLNIAVVGGYKDGKTKGCDGQKSFTETQKIIEHIIKTKPDHHIFFEGVLISTCFESWKNFFQEIQEKHPHIEPIVVFLDTHWKECIKLRCRTIVSCGILANPYSLFTINYHAIQSRGSGGTLPISQPTPQAAPYKPSKVEKTFDVSSK